MGYTARMNSPVRGRVTVHPRGFGFLAIEGAPETSAFVTPAERDPFLEGGVVSTRVVEGDQGRVSATDLSLVERSRSELFGSVTIRGKKPHLRVDRLVANTDWPLDEKAAEGIAEGTHLVATIRGKVLVPVRTIDDDADLAIERCVARHALRSVFPIDVEGAAAKSALLPRVGSRRDLREIPTVTIDAPSTTDIDDALAVLPAGADGALRVLVSIADVDAFVPEGSPVDEEARLRGTSVYLAGRVVPMLPEVLSSRAASLVPGEDRLALTAEMRIDPEGHVTAVDIYESLIRSHARLDYDSVAELMIEGRSDRIPEGVLPALRWLRTAAARLSAVRAARGGVDLAREEAYVELDAAGEPTAVEARKDTEAHRLVERLMVAANESVAAWLVARGLPGMFRVHDAPEPDRVHTLAELAHNFGIEPGFGPVLTPRGLAAFEAQFRTAKVGPAIRTVLGRTLGPARYTVHPSQHFGLGAPLYLHFTSPIRRYADLVVHRIVKRYLEGDRSMTAGEPEVEALAQRLNRASYVADKAEAERHRMLIARLFASRIGEEVHGNIVSVKPFGLVVQMTGTGATGTIAIDALPGGPYRIDLVQQALIGDQKRFNVGDPVCTIVASANEELGRVDLILAEEE